MRTHNRWLYLAEVLAAGVSVRVLVVTLLVPQWNEMLFDAAPDDGDGSLERWIGVGFACVATAVFAWLARREKRKPVVGSELLQTF